MLPYLLFPNNEEEVYSCSVGVRNSCEGPVPRMRAGTLVEKQIQRETINISTNIHSKTTTEERDISPKSVINAPFTSQPSSTSGSMEHKVLPRPLQGHSSFESEKSSKKISSAMLPESNALMPDLSVGSGIYGGKNPFSENFRNHPVDPLCKINLRETSEFVKSFPMAKDNKDVDAFTEKWTGENLVNSPNTELKLQKNKEANQLSVPKKLNCPGTPSRAFLGLQGGAENPLPVKYMMGSFARKPFPSKWDDAEKWLINSSCNESPSNHLGRLMKPSKPLGHFLETQPSDRSADNIRTVNDLHAKELKHGQFFSPRVGVCDEKMRAGSVDGNKDGKYLGGALSAGDVSSRVPSSVVSTEITLSSSFGSGSTELGAFAGLQSDILMKDKFTDKVEPAPKYNFSESARRDFYVKHEGFESMKDAGTEVFSAVQHRDMGTEMTPLGSSQTSRCHTPVKNASPARHNTPASRSGLLNSAGIDIGELEKCHFAKLELQVLSSGIQFNSVDKSVSNWSSREEEEEEISKSLRHFEMGECKKSIFEARAAAWEEAERSKCFTRSFGVKTQKRETLILLMYQREEARIEAWLNLQGAKAEAESRKLEVKIEKMRSNLEEKLMKKMAAAHKRAEEWRAAAQAQHGEQFMRTSERAERMRKDGNFFFTLPICSCFSCTHS
eukprot:Gb_07229 [translate_table: standard]